MKQREYSALIFVLKGLVPYSKQNLMLAYKPRKFFAELEKTSGYSQQTLKASYYRAKRTQLLNNDLVPQLTARGRQRLQPFVAKQLGNNASLMVIFDIPEASALLRRRFRLLLRNLSFQQVQLSVWITHYDHQAIIIEAIEELELMDCVQVYEAARIQSK